MTSNTANIPFDPATMQTGVTYYLAVIAGNNLNGNVDLNDNCLDISNASEVVWWPSPSVELSVVDPDICAGGCLTLNVTLMGVAPFTLSGNLLVGTSVIGTFSQNFNDNSGIMEVCAPSDAPPGDLLVQTTMLGDAHCTC